MSGAIRSIKKVFSKVGQAFKKIVKSKVFKAIIIAVAVYFTGGLALGAMGSAAAASMPGIAAAANTLGITAGAFGATAAGGAAASAAAASAAAAGMEGVGAGYTGSLAAAEAASAGAGAAGAAQTASGLAAATEGIGAGYTGSLATAEAALPGYGGAQGAASNLAALNPSAMEGVGAGYTGSMANAAPSTLGAVETVPMSQLGGPTVGTGSSNPGFFQKAFNGVKDMASSTWEGYKALPWQTQMTLNQAGMGGVGLMMQGRQQQAQIDAQREAEERRKGNYDPATLVPIKPGFYSRAGG